MIVVACEDIRNADPRGFEVDNLPDELKGRVYYEPSGNGEETK